MIFKRALFTTCIFLAGSLLLSAQEEASDINNTLQESRDRFILEFNHNNWFNTPDSADLKWYNRGVNLFMMYDFPIGSGKHFSFATGVGMSFHNIYHNTFIQEVRDTTSSNFGQTIFVPIDSTGLNYRGNKISTNYLEVPLELRFKSKPNKRGKSFKLAAGMRVAYMLNGHTKYRGQQRDAFGNIEDVKVKDLRIPNVNRFRFGPSIRLGYGDISLVSFISLSSLFDKSQGPDIREFSIGISFNSF